MTPNVVLDPNIWIYLSNPKLNHLLKRLNDEVDNENLKLLISDIIILEWDRNKEKTIRNLKREYNDCIDLINAYQVFNETRIYSTNKERFLFDKSGLNEFVNKYIEEVENLMGKCTLVESTVDQKLFIADIAIKGIPPLNNKNNFNDALIIRSIIESIEINYPYKYDFIFVTENIKDFVDPDTQNLFNSLTQGLEKIRIITTKELGKVLNLSEELIEDYEDWLEYHVSSYYDRDFLLNR